jgi:hypothetical protein
MRGVSEIVQQRGVDQAKLSPHDIAKIQHRVVNSDLRFLVSSVYLISNILMSKTSVLLAGMPGIDLLP